MSVGAAVVMNVKSGRSGTGHGTIGHVPGGSTGRESWVGHMPGGGSDMFTTDSGRAAASSPLAAFIIVISSFTIAAGFILTFIGFVARHYSVGKEGTAYRIAGPSLIGVGLLGVLSGCYYGKSLKQ